MKFRERHQEDLSIDLTPFIDVVFMLLLFFVVSATLFKGATQFEVQLPSANATKLTKEQDAVSIGIDAQGFYSLNGVALETADPKRLKVALAAKLGDSQLPLLLMGDKTAPHQAVVSALEVAGELGVTQVQIVAKQHSNS